MAVKDWEFSYGTGDYGWVDADVGSYSLPLIRAVDAWAVAPNTTMTIVDGVVQFNLRRKIVTEPEPAPEPRIITVDGIQYKEITNA